MAWRIFINNFVHSCNGCAKEEDRDGLLGKVVYQGLQWRGVMEIP